MNSKWCCLTSSRARAVLRLVRHEALVQLQLFRERGAQGVVVIHDQDLLVVGHGGSSSRDAAGTGLAAGAVSARMTSIKSHQVKSA